MLYCFGISRFSVSKVKIAEESMERKHFIIICSLTIEDQVIPTHALIDCGATGISFMDQDFAHYHQVLLRELNETKIGRGNQRKNYRLRRYYTPG
jgi:hypothetical protein